MKTLDFGTAFMYPFNRAKGMWNILWVFFPIFGWFALGGYGVRIAQEFIKGKYKELPVMDFGEDMKFGFMMFVKALPFVIAFIAVTSVLYKIEPLAGGLAEFFLGVFVLPVLAMNFFKKETVESFFEFRVLRAVFDNLGDYIWTILRSIALGVIFLLMWVVLVGIPAGSFSKNIFLADFYRRRVK